MLSGPFQGPVVANFATREFKAKKAAVLYDIASDYPKGLAEFFKEAFEKLHGPGSVVAFETFTTKDRDFSAQLTKIVKTDADFLFTPQYYDEVPLIAKQAHELGSDRKNQRVDTLSGGEQQMLATGRAFMCGADVILLDEPSMGLSPILMQGLFKVLMDLNGAGMTIFVMEQNAHIALKYAHRAYLMEAGRIVMAGNSSELAANPEIQKAYLG